MELHKHVHQTAHEPLRSWLHICLDVTDCEILKTSFHYDNNSIKFVLENRLPIFRCL